MGMQAPSGAVMADINITPLVDVMLVLLIIFMVAAPVMEKERSKQELDENRDKQQRLVVLNLPALDKKPVAESDLPRTLPLHISEQLLVRLDGKTISDCSPHALSPDKRAWQGCLDAVEAALLGHSEAQSRGIAVDADPMARFGFIVAVMHRLHKANIEKVSMFPK